MPKQVNVKITLAPNSQADNFSIRDNTGTVIATGVPKATLIAGAIYTVADTIVSLTIDSTGICTSQDVAVIVPVTNTYNNYSATRHTCPNCDALVTITVSVPTSITVSLGQFLDVNDGYAYRVDTFLSTGAATGQLMIGATVENDCTAICGA
jgi:hypothetical protein